MIINSKKIISLMEELAPLELCEEWDNSGFLIGNIDSEINKIMIVLDVNEDVVEEAIEKNVGLIISHHPFIFSPLGKIVDHDYKGKLVRKLIKNDINIYSAHTNLDSAENGINDDISEILKLKNIEAMEIGRIGDIEAKLAADEFLLNLKKIFNLETLKFSGKINREIKRVAVCSGSGSDLIDLSKNMGCDLFITGDVKYHEAQKAEELGIIIVDLGHFESENIYMERLLNILNERCQEKNYDVRIVLSESFKSPFSFI